MRGLQVSGGRACVRASLDTISVNPRFVEPNFYRHLQLLASRPGLLIFVFRTSCPQGLIKGGAWLLHGKTKTEIIQHCCARQGRCA